MRYIVMLVAITLLLPVTAVAEHPDDVAGSVVREGARAAFEELERQMIYKYFNEHAYHRDHDYDRDHRGKGPGKKGLPPGIQMKLERGGTMPPGIAKQYLPDDLSHRLPPPPQGYERTIVGNDVLLVEKVTGRIADILVDAVLGE